MGKLIIIEAGDGSGKATQTAKLYERLLAEGHKVRKITFPNYDSDSSALVKMYLKGDFGQSADDVNPYVASTFYTVDRYASFKKEWEEFYNEGGIVIADRYTTSNMVHQASKIKDSEELERYLDWLWEFEFGKFGLPVPDAVLFLNMPPECSEKLMAKRMNKFTGEAEKDIHEKDSDHLRLAYENAINIAGKYDWIKIDCVAEGEIRSIDSIHETIYHEVITKII